MTTKILPARIDVESALKRFRRPRLGNLFGLWQAPPVKLDEQGQPASLELVWMPVYGYLFNFIYKGKQTSAWVSVDASFGGFALLGRVNDIIEGTPDGEAFSPVLTPEAGERLAREGVIRYILRKRGLKPSVDDISDRMTFHTPVWVYYFRTIGGKIDLAVRDAYSGDPMGGLVRRAVVEAFIARSREKANV